MGVLLEFRHGETGKLRLCFFVNVNAPDFFSSGCLTVYTSMLDDATIHGCPSESSKLINVPFSCLPDISSTYFAPYF